MRDVFFSLGKTRCQNERQGKLMAVGFCQISRLTFQNTCSLEKTSDANGLRTGGVCRADQDIFIG